MEAWIVCRPLTLTPLALLLGSEKRILVPRLRPRHLQKRSAATDGRARVMTVHLLDHPFGS
jgi:hypothetical protein